MSERPKSRARQAVPSIDALMRTYLAENPRIDSLACSTTKGADPR